MRIHITTIGLIALATPGLATSSITDAVQEAGSAATTPAADPAAAKAAEKAARLAAKLEEKAQAEAAEEEKKAKEANKNEADIAKQKASGIQVIVLSDDFRKKAYETGWAGVMRQSPEHGPKLKELFAKAN